MNMKRPSQHDLLALKRYTLFVMFICYVPHIATEPLWLFMFFVTAIGYRLVADYFSYPPLRQWMRIALVLACLVILNEGIRSSGFVIRFLLTFIILKCLEFHTLRDIKVLILCNFLIIFSALIVIQELWMVIYLLIAVMANLSLMLKLNTSEITLKQMGGKSSQQLLIAIPLCIVLFYVFPRIDPLWHVPTLSRASTGFNEKMSFGSIAELFQEDSMIMQITFRETPLLDGYWRGTVLSFYTGTSWLPSGYDHSSFLPLPELNANEIADYEILLEPNQTKWLFYTGYPRAGRPSLSFSPSHGLIRQNKEPVVQRFGYSVKVAPSPYSHLNPGEYAEAMQLPIKSDPQLMAWAKEQFSKANNNLPAFIAFLQEYIHQQPFWYTLTPPVLSSERNQMDSFWFSTRKGFCEHYASAVTFILRAAGIPARVVVGYQGGEWNPITHAITIKQNNAHAWLEYWQEGVGWQQFDPTAFIATERIDPTIRLRQIENLNPDDYLNIAEFPWQQKVRFFFESMRFYSQRWFLFYNQNTQQNLLQNIGLGSWNKGDLLQASVGCLVLFLILLGLYYQWQQRRMQDGLLLEYHMLQKQFQRFSISRSPSSTLKQQCKSLASVVPSLEPILTTFIKHYELLRLRGSNGDSKEKRSETMALFKDLRYALRKINNK